MRLVKPLGGYSLLDHERNDGVQQSPYILNVLEGILESTELVRTDEREEHLIVDEEASGHRQSIHGNI